MHNLSGNAPLPALSPGKCLERQEWDRVQNVPVLTFLWGRRDRALDEWDAFYSSRDRPTLTAPSLLDPELPGRIALLAFAAANARTRSARWFAARTGRDSEQVIDILNGGALGDLRLLVEQANVDIQDVSTLSRIPVFQGVFDHAPSAAQLDMGRALAFLASVLGLESIPAILLCPPETAGPEELLPEIRGTEALFLHVPGARLGVTLEGEQGQWLTTALSGTRQGALLEEGLIRLLPSSGRMGECALPGEETLERHLARLLPPPTPPPIRSAWRDATLSAGAIKKGHAPCRDRARSAVERFLYTVLEQHPETRGRFGLNIRLKTHSGTLPLVEVDFLAAGERLAVEVDGWYHFRDAAAWRHDRLKDLVLQQEGYTVARYLAEDVMHSIDTVINSIICALEAAQRRSNSHE